jgi:hypothetical protein
MFPVARLSRALSASSSSSIIMMRRCPAATTGVAGGPSSLLFVRRMQSQQAAGASTTLLDAPQQFLSSRGSLLFGGLLLAAASVVGGGAYGSSTTTTTKADVVGVGGTPIQEPVTGILFPKLVNGFYFAGCGVRIKYMFVKVYAVASYFDPLAMTAVKANPLLLQEALLNPVYPRTIVIIMNRNLSAAKMTAALIEALEPRMAGQDLDKLDEFKKMNPVVDLVKGTAIYQSFSV